MTEAYAQNAIRITKQIEMEQKQCGFAQRRHRRQRPWHPRRRPRNKSDCVLARSAGRACSMAAKGGLGIARSPQPWSEPAYSFLKKPDRMFGPASPGRSLIPSSKPFSVTHSKP